MGDIVRPPTNKAKLETHEQTVRSGFTAWFATGDALAAIQEDELYIAAGFVTFEVYCEQRWDMQANHVRRLIAASRTARLLPDSVPRTTLNERQLRPLVALGTDAEAVTVVWGEAEALAKSHGRNVPTAADVQAAVAARQPKPSPPADPIEVHSEEKRGSGVTPDDADAEHETTQKAAPMGRASHVASCEQITFDFEAASVSALAALGKPRLVAVQRKINEALRVVR